MEQAVQDWVSRNPVRYGYLLDFFRRGGRVCYAGVDGLVLKNDQFDICYAGGTAFSPELAESKLVLVEDKALAERLAARESRLEIMECVQCMYLKKEPPQARRFGVQLRPLTLEDLDFVLENYHHPGSVEGHIRGRIAEGMLGAEADGQLAGFIGVHEEGAMGLLEILPQFRRRGLAEILEASMIKQQLDRGYLPYAQVRIGNSASEALQKKLGMTFDDRVFYWIG